MLGQLPYELVRSLPSRHSGRLLPRIEEHGCFPSQSQSSSTRERGKRPAALATRVAPPQPPWPTKPPISAGPRRSAGFLPSEPLPKSAFWDFRKALKKLEASPKSAPDRAANRAEHLPCVPVTNAAHPCGNTDRRIQGRVVLREDVQEWQSIACRPRKPVRRPSFQIPPRTIAGRTDRYLPQRRVANRCRSRTSVHSSALNPMP